MDRDERLNRLMSSLGEIIGMQIPDEHVSIGDLGIDSKYLADIILVCEEIYGYSIDFEAIDISYETSLHNIHRQLSDGGDART